jgi:hypothetical protein
LPEDNGGSTRGDAEGDETLTVAMSLDKSTMFDTGLRHVLTAEPLAQVPALDGSSYEPVG